MRAAMLVLVAGLTLPPAGTRADDPPKRREFVGRTQAVAAVEVRARVAGVGLLALARTSQEFPSPDGKGVPAVGQKIDAPVPQDEARAEAVKLLGSLTPLARAAAPVPKDNKADKKLRENVDAADLPPFSGPTAPSRSSASSRGWVCTSATAGSGRSCRSRPIRDGTTVQ